MTVLGSISRAGTPKVCHVVYSLAMGGVEVLAARIARRLRHSWRFSFACLDEEGVLGAALRREGFPVFVVGRRPGVDLCCSMRLARLLRRLRVDLLHAHTYGPFFYGALARGLAPRSRILFAEHARPHPDFRRRKRIVANRLLLTKGDRIVAVSESARKALIENEGHAQGDR